MNSDRWLHAPEVADELLEWTSEAGRALFVLEAVDRNEWSWLRRVAFGDWVFVAVAAAVSLTLNML